MEGLIHNSEPNTLPAFILKDSHYIISNFELDQDLVNYSWFNHKPTIYREDKVIGPVVLGVWE